MVTVRFCDVEGDLLEGCDRGPGVCEVGEEEGEGRDDGVARAGAVGAGEDHVELVARGQWGQRRSW